mmetsp:Transcript_86439/g.192478  ORF Transcript_86439/g.192478 Transcript_86439/m.192478 type:complete len:237 (+) Transcript_86439:187-897(+)
MKLQLQSTQALFPLLGRHAEEVAELSLQLRLPGGGPLIRESSKHRCYLALVLGSAAALASVAAIPDQIACLDGLMTGTADEAPFVKRLFSLCENEVALYRLLAPPANGSLRIVATLADKVVLEIDIFCLDWYTTRTACEAVHMIVLPFGRRPIVQDRLLTPCALWTLIRKAWLTQDTLFLAWEVHTRDQLLARFALEALGVEELTLSLNALLAITTVNRLGAAGALGRPGGPTSLA